MFEVLVGGVRPRHFGCAPGSTTERRGEVALIEQDEPVWGGVPAVHDADPGGHHPDFRVHDAPLRAFTIARYPQDGSEARSR